MIKGTVVFSLPGANAISKAMAQVAAANPRLDLASYLYQTPVTLNFVPASWGYPDRWFIHWDQIPN